MLLLVDETFGIADQDPSSSAALDQILGISPAGNPTPLRWSHPQSNGVDFPTADDDGKKIVEEIVWLLQLMESRRGSMPQFLYKKKLEKSDVDKGLFLSGGESEMMAFLREEERAAVNGGGKGLTIVGVDGGGRVYEKVVLTKLSSVKMLVIKSDWVKIVKENEAKEGEVMEIWGFRENDKPCLAFKIF